MVISLAHSRYSEKLVALNLLSTFTGRALCPKESWA